MNSRTTRHRYVRLTDEAKKRQEFDGLGEIGLVQSTTQLRRLGVTTAYSWVLFGQRLVLIQDRDLIDADA